MNPTDIRDQAHAVRLENAKSPHYSQAVEDLCNNVGLLVLEHVGVCAELTEWKEKHTIVVEKYNLACEENEGGTVTNTTERLKREIRGLIWWFYPNDGKSHADSVAGIVVAHLIVAGLVHVEDTAQQIAQRLLASVAKDVPELRAALTQPSDGGNDNE